MNTGQTVYEQLQDILIKCIELGLYIDGCDFTVEYIYFEHQQLMICNDIEGKQSKSVHWLFSKDSGLMEFVEWKKKGGLYGLHYSYESMSNLTAHEKVTWFVNNAIIPTK